MRSGAGAAGGGATTRRARAGMRAGWFEEEAVEEVVAVRKQALTFEEEVIALRNDALTLLGTSSLSLSLCNDSLTLLGNSSACPKPTRKEYHAWHAMWRRSRDLVCLLPLAVSFVCSPSLSWLACLLCLLCLCVFPVPASTLGVSRFSPPCLRPRVSSLSRV